MNVSLVGRTYGPFTYEVGAEKIREFAFAIGGGVPSLIYPQTPPEGLSRAYWDEAFAREHGGLVAPPTFAVNFAIRPFVTSTLDPELGLNMLRLVHGEQEFEHLVPVRAGDVMTTTGTLVELLEKASLNVVVMRTESKNQRGETAVRATWTAVIRK